MLALRSCSSRNRRRAVLVATLAFVCVSAACGGGGGGGGGSSELEILEEATFLLNDGGADPRTGQKLQFILRGLGDPGAPLTEDDIEVYLDGELDTESRARVNPPDVDKSEITLVLDVSSSLTPTDLEKVKASASTFVEELLSLASRLRIYYFSSPSQSQLLGEYEVVDAGGLAWSPDPTADINAIPGGDDSTALFHAVRNAIAEVPVTNDILVVFSDGKENSSPQGAREEALSLIEENQVVVFSVGFGGVDPDELHELSDPYGEFLGVRASLDDLFDEVAGRIQSVYTVVYDTPTSFGTHELELRIRVEGKRLSHTAEIEAGIDLAKATYGRYPSLPGSIVELNDLTQTPPVVRTYSVLPAAQAQVGVDGLFAFAIEPTHACPGVDCVLVYQGSYGEGSRDEAGGIYLPAELVEGATWPDPISGEELTFAGFESIEVLRGTGDRRTYECAKVTFAGGTHWFAKEVGLIRTTNAAGDVVVELGTPPCLSSSFDGGCAVQ